MLAVLADMVIFGFLLVRLPRASVPWWTAVRGAALAAVGYELLKLLGTYYIARVTSSPAASAVGSVLGVLVFFNLVFRYLLFCVAWIATGIDRWDYVVAIEDLDEPDIVAPPPVPGRAEPLAPAPSPTAVAGTLLGVGAALGAGAVAATRWYRRRARPAGED